MVTYIFLHIYVIMYIYVSQLPEYMHYRRIRSPTSVAHALFFGLRWSEGAAFFSISKAQFDKLNLNQIWCDAISKVPVWRHSFRHVVASRSDPCYIHIRPRSSLFGSDCFFTQDNLKTAFWATESIRPWGETHLWISIQGRLLCDERVNWSRRLLSNGNGSYSCDLLHRTGLEWRKANSGLPMRCLLCFLERGLDEQHIVWDRSSFWSYWSPGFGQPGKTQRSGISTIKVIKLIRVWWRFPVWEKSPSPMPFVATPPILPCLRRCHGANF